MDKVKKLSKYVSFFLIPFFFLGRIQTVELIHINYVLWKEKGFLEVKCR